MLQKSLWFPACTFVIANTYTVVCSQFDIFFKCFKYIPYLHLFSLFISTLLSLRLTAYTCFCLLLLFLNPIYRPWFRSFRSIFLYHFFVTYPTFFLHLLLSLPTYPGFPSQSLAYLRNTPFR